MWRADVCSVHGVRSRGIIILFACRNDVFGFWTSCFKIADIAERNIGDLRKRLSLDRLLVDQMFCFRCERAMNGNNVGLRKERWQVGVSQTEFNAGWIVIDVISQQLAAESFHDVRERGADLAGANDPPSICSLMAALGSPVADRSPKPRGELSGLARAS
jgi:hypothetical protein